MSTHKLPSNWLDNPSDKDLVKRSVGRGLGTIIDANPQIQKLAELAEAAVVCKRGHANTLGKIESVHKCQCGAKWDTIKGEKLTDEDETTTPTYERMIKSGEVETGGSLDGQPLFSNPQKARRPYVFDERPSAGLEPRSR